MSHNDSQKTEKIGFWSWVWESLCGMCRSIRDFFCPSPPPKPLPDINVVKKEIEAFQKKLIRDSIKENEYLYSTLSKSKDPKIARTAWMYDKPKTLERRMSFSDITIKHPSLPSSKTQDTEFHKPITVTFLKR